VKVAKLLAKTPHITTLDLTYMNFSEEWAREMGSNHPSLKLIQMDATEAGDIIVRPREEAEKQQEPTTTTMN